MFNLKFTELVREARRRRVFRTAGLYIIGAWIVVQIALAAFPALLISDAAVRYVWFAAILGFPAAIVFGWRYDIRGGRVVRTGPAETEVPLSLQRGDFLVLAALGVVAVAIVAGSVREITSMQSPEGRTSAAVHVDSASVAVLPFANMSADPSNEYFSDGLTETLLHMLAQLDDIKVAARTSSFAFKGQSQDIREIAQALGVAHVLEGSVQRANNRVRVTAQLIRATDGFHVWSQNYDRTLDDIFRIQDEISADVASALGSSLLVGARSAMQGIDTENFSAYDIYLHALEQQNINTNEALDEAEHLFERAIDADPEFVDAKIGLARNYIWKRRKDANNSDVNYLAALEVLEELRERRPDNVSVEMMYLLVQFFIGVSERTNWGTTEELMALRNSIADLAQATKLDSFLTRYVVALISGRPLQRDDEALELLRAALESDPLNFELLWAQANLYRRTDQPELARQPLLTALKLAPKNPELPESLGYLALQQDRYDEALQWFRQASALDPEDISPVFTIAVTFYNLGFLAEGNDWREKARAIDPDNCAVAALDTTAANLAGDEEALIEFTERDLRQVIVQPSFCYTVIDFYVWTMINRGQAQQALDFLTELLPGLQEYANPIVDNRRAQYIQAMSLFIQYTLVDQETFRRMVAKYRDALTIHFPDLDEVTASVYLISYEFVVGNVDRAKEIYLETHDHTNLFRWLQFLSYPWLAEFREDPEVIPLMEAWLEKRAGFVDDVRALLEQPDWQL